MEVHLSAVLYWHSLSVSPKERGKQKKKEKRRKRQNAKWVFHRTTLILNFLKKNLWLMVLRAKGQEMLKKKKNTISIRRDQEKNTK